MTDQDPTCGSHRHLSFVRHGATAPNLAGLRCGGDFDAPLTDLGRQQALAAARQLAAVPPRIGLIVCSALQRTDETARIIAQALGGVRVSTVPALAERRLGEWNLRPIAETQPWLASGMTPPAGEANADFVARIAGAVEQLLPLLHHGVLLVGSKGVARVLGELTGCHQGAAVDNGRVLQFALSDLRRCEALGSRA